MSAVMDVCPVCGNRVDGSRDAAGIFLPTPEHRASCGTPMQRAEAEYRSARDANDQLDVKRVPVEYRYDAINPEFLKRLARIGHYASEKYGAWEQYTKTRLVGEKSPINHAYEHLRCYVMGEPYDHFDGDPRWHLVARIRTSWAGTRRLRPCA